ncbi:MAG: hypothetical protein ACQEV7_09715 [Bacillota bacterium]
MNQNASTYLAWQAFNKDVEEASLEKTYNSGGGGYSTGGYTQFIRTINNEELK